jgi:2-dehydro-3-deoxyglucarate aldolase/4-hydroxy-2-oxoheptanedioate aldolase
MAHALDVGALGLMVPNVQTPEDAARIVEAIAAVEGIDVLWVGHFDLTVSMGIPGAFGDPRFLDAMARAAGAAAGRGLAAGFNVDTVAAGHEWIARGFRMLAYQADFRLLAGALAAGIDGLRAPRAG